MEEIRQGDIPGVQIRCREVVPLEPAQLWIWLTEPTRLARWMASDVIAREDGFELDGPEDAGSGGRELLSTLRLEPGSRAELALSRPDAAWPAPMRLTLEVSRHPEGSELSLLHEGFQQLSLTICLTVWEAYRRRWRSALARLRTAASATN